MNDQEDMINMLLSNKSQDSDDSDVSNAGGGLSQGASAMDSGALGVASPEYVTKAGAHLEDVYNSVLERQQQMNEINNSAHGGMSRAEQMAFWGGAGSKFGSFGTNMAQGMADTAPYTKARESMYQSGQEKLMELRLKAAQDQASNARLAALAGIQRNDKAASLGMRVGPNGQLMVDPTAMEALRMKANMVEKGKMSAQGLDAFSPVEDTNGKSGAAVIPTRSAALPHNLAVLMAESGGNLNTPPGDGGKAIGPMQLHEAAAEEVGVTDRNDVMQNLMGGKAYLEKYTDVFKDKPNPTLWATVAYKDGPGYAKKWSGDLEDLSDGTQKYIDKVNDYMKGSLYGNQSSYTPEALADAQKMGQGVTPEGGPKKYDFGTTGIDNIDDKLDKTGYRQGVKSQMAEYLSGRKQLPGAFSMRSPYWIKMGEELAKVDPTFDAHRYDTNTKFNTAIQGNTTRALNVSIAHLDTFKQLAAALDSGNVQMINKAKNMWKTQFGSDAPTNVDLAKQLISGEIVKAITTSGGGVTDREETHKQLSSAKSWKQIVGAVNTYHGLLGGQLDGLRQQYKAGMGGNDEWANVFDKKYLTPQTRNILKPSKSGPETHDELPDASKYTGKIATDQLSGAKFKSDGKSWVAVP